MTYQEALIAIGAKRSATRAVALVFLQAEYAKLEAMRAAGRLEGCVVSYERYKHLQQLLGKRLGEADAGHP